MDLIKNYEDSLQAISEHVGGVDGWIGEYSLSTEFNDCFFTFFAENGEIGWAKELEDLEEQDGDYYQSECAGFYRGEDIILALIYPDCGGDNYWLVFKTKNEIKN